MEAKLNIANILKNKPKGTKLYADAFGELKLVKVDKVDTIYTRTKEGMFYSFYNDGKYNKNGEPILVPSKEMRNWSKFAWKRGDALSCGVDNLCIFEKWANKEYTEFYAKFVTPNYSGNTFKTEKWSKETNEAVIKQYISNIEEFKGGKLNLTTLEIEKTQPEFKDGDIVTIINGCEQRCILIFRNIIGDSLNRYCILTKRGLFTEGYSLIDKEDSLLFATEEEKNKLFSALEKEGKAWDSEKKQIVDLKPKCEFKPFDKVVVRCSEADRWSIDFFSYKVHNGYICTGDAWFGYCLPYNDETAHLLGTTDDWKGGEG